MELSPGTRLGRYEIVGRLASGGMAEVYLGRLHGHSGFTRLVALKRMLPELAQEPGFHEMFLHEASIAARLSHPRIVPILDFASIDGEVFLAMEFVHGVTLRKLLRDALACEPEPSTGIRGLVPLVAAQIGVHIAEALDYAWSTPDDEGRPLHLVHRDVSPQNILISYLGEVKLADFGIARPAEHRTVAGVLKGKLLYMAPEQLEDGALDARTDLFALGAVLYEAACSLSRPLFDAGDGESVKEAVRSRYLVPPTRMDPEFPPTLSEVLLHALERDPTKRFQTAAEMATALKEAIRLDTRRIGESEVAACMARVYGSPPSPLSVTGSIPLKSQGAARSDRSGSGPALPPLLHQGETRVVSRPRSLSASMPSKGRPRGRRRLVTPVAALLLLGLGAGGWVWRQRSMEAPPVVSATPEAKPEPTLEPALEPTPEPVPTPEPLLEPVAVPPEPVAAPTPVAPKPAEPPRPSTPPSEKKPVGQGSLVVLLRPWGFVWVDGERFHGGAGQEAAPRSRRTLSAGSHRIHLQSATGARRELRVEIKPGQVTTIKDPF